MGALVIVLRLNEPLGAAGDLDDGAAAVAAVRQLLPGVGALRVVVVLAAVVHGLRRLRVAGELGDDRLLARVSLGAFVVCARGAVEGVINYCMYGKPG